MLIDMGYYTAQSNRNDAMNRVVPLRVSKEALCRTRALVRVTPCTRLDQAVEEALRQHVESYHACPSEITEGKLIAGRQTSAVMPVRVSGHLIEEVRAAVAGQPGMTLASFVSAALSTWCERHPLATQQLAVPRDLRRGGRRRSQRAPRDLFVILDDE
jgi:hypothetical protein